MGLPDLEGRAPVTGRFAVVQRLSASAEPEKCQRRAYDDEGQFLSGTFMTYLVPTAMEIPEIEIHHLAIETDPEVDFRGVGEGGAIIAPAAIANAVEDALTPFGVTVDTFPLTPTRILELTGVLDSA